jgi:chorismate mutase
MQRVQAIRGATTVVADTREEILAATRELITELIGQNNLEPGQVISAFFTATPDLTGAFPAEAVRQLGYTAWAALDCVEMAVPGALARCIRVLVHAYLKCGQEVRHVYLREAKALRRDRVDHID